MRAESRPAGPITSAWSEWTESLGSATIAIREHMNHARSQLLQTSGEVADRVLKSASGTAKYTLHQRCMANALGFGPDDVAPRCAPDRRRQHWARPKPAHCAGL